MIIYDYIIIKIIYLINAYLIINYQLFLKTSKNCLRCILLNKVFILEHSDINHQE